MKTAHRSRRTSSLTAHVVAGVVSLVFTAIVIAPAGAREEADPCGPAVKDPQRLAESGLRLYKEAAGMGDPSLRSKHYERALRCFIAAMQSNRGATSKLYHPLGLVYEKLDRDVEAVESFERFLADVPEDRRNVGVTKQITDKLNVLKRRVAQLDIDTVAGLSVRVDEKEVGKAPLGRLVTVTPGTHIVIVGNAELGTLGAEVAVLAGQVRRVDLTAWHPRGVAEAGAEPWKQVTQEAGKAGPKVAEERRPQGYLLITSNRAGASVQVDREGLRQLPLPELALGVGEHVVAARDGSQSLSRRVSLLPDEHRTLDLHFPVKTWVWVVTGVAAAVVVGGAITLGAYYGTGTNHPDVVVANWH